MDSLQAKHAFDHLEMRLQEIKDEFFRKFPNKDEIADLEERVEDLENELWLKDDRIRDVSRDASDAISELEALDVDDNTKASINSIIKNYLLPISYL